MDYYTAIMEEAAAELVENGTITQETADKLTEFKDNQAATKTGICTLTEEQRTALCDAGAAAFKSGITELAREGTITQEQADQMTQGREMMRGLGLTEEQRDALMQVKEDALKAAVTELVEKGTLTEDEADAISAMQTAKQSADKMTAEIPAGILTDDQKTALADEVKSIFESKLADLVDDGTITQELRMNCRTVREPWAWAWDLAAADLVPQQNCIKMGLHNGGPFFFT